ncbi:MAG TPA: hypothetical protein VFR85_15795 [Anaeromyxobacteraceae bacterium]|nr:hypothetical protein [Anaeromyxobacteraceae bacterium]
MPSHHGAAAGASLARSLQLRRCPLRRLVAAAFLVFPAAAWPEPASVAREVDLPAEAEVSPLVAEALFLCDPLPPGGRDLNLAVAVARGEPDPATGRAAFAVLPRLQLALALGDRAGLTAEVGLGTATAPAVDSPAASFKVLLREPGEERTGLAANLDLYGSTRSFLESEAGVGLGAIRALGPLTLRASGTLVSGLRAWSPHLHAGVSAAAAIGPAWRALGEVVAQASRHGIAVSAGPAVKVALGARASLTAGALFDLGSGPRLLTFTTQVGHAL